MLYPIKTGAGQRKKKVQVALGHVMTHSVMQLHAPVNKLSGRKRKWSFIARMVKFVIAIATEMIRTLHGTRNTSYGDINFPFFITGCIADVQSRVENITPAFSRPMVFDDN